MSAVHRWEGAVRHSLSKVLLGAMFLLALKEIRLGGKCEGRS